MEKAAEKSEAAEAVPASRDAEVVMEETGREALRIRDSVYRDRGKKRILERLGELARTLRLQAKREREQRILALWFTPGAIRDHFDVDGEEVREALAAVSDEQLAKCGEEAVNDDRLWRVFHELCIEVYEKATGMEYR